MEQQSIINVLCLHGCNQTQKMFEGLMKNIVKMGEKQYGLKFYFTEAKYDHPLGGKTLYKHPLNVADIGRIAYDDDLVRDTLDDIEKDITERQIHVLLGFSQGANVVDTFLQYRRNHNIRSAIIISGYSLVDANRKTIEVPVMGISSAADTVVPHDLTPINYSALILVQHDKGHKLPTQNGIIRQMCTFMQSGKIQSSYTEWDY